VVIDAPGGDLPLLQLDAAALEPIVANVPGTGGTVAILKHYLPRICELVVASDDDDLAGAGWIDREDPPNARRNTAPPRGGPWWEWPGDEQVALRAFFDAWWRQDRRAGVNTAETTLAALSQFVPDLGRYLDAWSRDPDPDAIACRDALREEAAALGALDGPL